jgi:hypothetical protein
VAEWQTRQTQNLLSERTWEFKSPRPHQLSHPNRLETCLFRWVCRGRHDDSLLAKPCGVKEPHSN